MNTTQDHARFIWIDAELLRGGCKLFAHGTIVLPLTALRRLGCVRASTKVKTLAVLPRIRALKVQNIDSLVEQVAGQCFFNISRFDLAKLLQQCRSRRQVWHSVTSGLGQPAPRKRSS